MYAFTDTLIRGDHTKSPHIKISVNVYTGREKYSKNSYTYHFKDWKKKEKLTLEVSPPIQFLERV